MGFLANYQLNNKGEKMNPEPSSWEKKGSKIVFYDNNNNDNQNEPKIPPEQHTETYAKLKRSNTALIIISVLLFRILPVIILMVLGFV